MPRHTGAAEAVGCTRLRSGRLSRTASAKPAAGLTHNAGQMDDKVSSAKQANDKFVVSATHIKPYVDESTLSGGILTDFIQQVFRGIGVEATIRYYYQENWQTGFFDDSARCFTARDLAPGH